MAYPGERIERQSQMTMTHASLARHLEAARDNALRAAEIAAQGAGSRPDLAEWAEIEAQLADADLAERRLAAINALEARNTQGGA